MTQISDARAKEYGLEPQAMSKGYSNIADLPSAPEVERSKAISLRRITFGLDEQNRLLTCISRTLETLEEIFIHLQTNADHR